MNNDQENKSFRPRNFDDSDIKTITNLDSDTKVTSKIHCGAICAKRGSDKCQGFLWNPELGADNCRLVNIYNWACHKQTGSITVYTFLH